MKIWYVTMNFPVPRETFAYCDIKALQRLGHQVEVHCLLRPHRTRDHLVTLWNLSVPTRYPTARSLALAFFHALRCPSAVLAALRCSLAGNTRISHIIKAMVLIPRALDLLALYKRQTPDVVHLFWGHFPSLVGYVIKSTCPRSVVTMFLGTYDLLTGFSGAAKMARVADCVFTHAKVNIPAILALGVERAKVVLAYRGVDSTIIDSPIPTTKVRHRIISVGVLEHSKGIMRVLEVYRQVHARIPDLSLTILGEGSARKAVAHFVAAHRLTNVTIAGYVAHEIVMEKLRESEVLLFLSDIESERLPNIVKEAVAEDCLCVVSRTPGIEELIPQGSGFVVSAHDIPAACAAVMKALADREGALLMRRRARAHLRRHFNAAVTMRTYVEHWAVRLGESTGWEGTQFRNLGPKASGSPPDAV